MDIGAKSITVGYPSHKIKSRSAFKCITRDANRKWTPTNIHIFFVSMNQETGSKVQFFYILTGSEKGR